MTCPLSLACLRWPLFEELTNKQQMHIHFRMSQKKILPKEYTSHYKNKPDYIYPHTLEFRFFVEVPNKGLATTSIELKDSGWP